MKIPKFISLIFLCISLLKASGAQGLNNALIVVVKMDSEISHLSQKQVMSLFLGRAKFLPTGGKAKPLDFPTDSITRADFYRALTGKNIADIDAYWARLKYSGRASPPQSFESGEKIIEMVSRLDDAIAYLPEQFEGQLSEKGLKSVLTVRIN